MIASAGLRPFDGHLRPASADDFPEVARLFAALHTFNATLDGRFRLSDEWRTLLEQHYQRTLNAPGALWLLAWQEKRAVGLLIVEAHTDSPLYAERRWAELVALYVVPSQRGGDLAAQLVHASTAWATQQGFDRLQLYVTAHNERARRFYARCGLAPTQEIWRLDLLPQPTSTPPDDPSCHEPHPGCQLESGHHHLAMELDTTLHEGETS